MGLLEDGYGEYFGGVEGVDLEFQVVYFGEEAGHGFAELFFLGLEFARFTFLDVSAGFSVSCFSAPVGGSTGNLRLVVGIGVED